ncbi:hypothetical protein [Rhizobium sp. SGZ-381]|uniref:hypothetical protein n=1 Tax=Rhizobium sp. SGZ-381 TaxID=3342800 RepID=UPI00366B4F8D
MILEAFNYAASWPLTPKPFRPHIASSISLLARANRCRAAWGHHEDNSKAHVLSAINSLKQRRTAVVLGSGLLRDVPILELSRAFDTVVLVDLVHLASVRTFLAARRLSNTRLIWRDLSGLDEAVAGKMPEPLGFLRQVPYLDLVVSANILSQIGVGARARLEATGQSASAETVLPALVGAHLHALATVAAKTCLITDVSYRIEDRGGKILEEHDLLAGVPVPAHDKSWDWPVVPLEEARGAYRAVHRVVAG